MDDERQQGSWWGNLETIHPDEDHEDYIEYIIKIPSEKQAE